MYPAVAEHSKGRVAKSNLSSCQCFPGIAVSCCRVCHSFACQDSLLLFNCMAAQTGTTHKQELAAWSVVMCHVLQGYRAKACCDGAGTSADMYRTVFELLVSVKLFLGRFDMRTMQVSHLCTHYCANSVACASVITTASSSCSILTV